MSVLAIYRDPFTLGSPNVEHWPVGMNIVEMVDRMRNLPANFATDGGVVMVSGEVVPFNMWHLVRPKAYPVLVTFYAPLQGGGGGGKQVFQTIAALALTLASAGAIGGLFATGGWFLAGSTSAIALGAGISLVGSLALAALSPPPVRPKSRDDRVDSSINGNVLDPNGPIPRVIGTMRVFPPLAAHPLSYFSGANSVVEAVYALNGPHLLEDIQIDGVPVADIEGVEIETREGWATDTSLTLVTRQSVTTVHQIEMSSHVVDGDSQNTLDDTVSNALPQWHMVRTGSSPDEFLIHLLLPAGLSKNASETDDHRIPFQIRARLRGDTVWRILPELHYRASTGVAKRLTIKLMFGTNGVPAQSLGNSNCWCEARRFHNGQSVAPAVADFSVDTCFVGVSGDTFLDSTNESTTAVINVDLKKNVATIYMQEAFFPRGIYEVEIKRGNTFDNSDYVASGYTYLGTNYDFYTYRDSGADRVIPETRSGVVDTVTLLQTVSIWNNHPIESQGFALIAIKGVNVRVEKLSVMASGYVKDWDGSGWNTWVTTSNPAPHYNDILTGSLNIDPLPVVLRDNDSLTAWRTACTSLGYTCNMFADDMRVQDVLSIVAACGYARSYQSEIWGVIRDRDMSAEPPVQLFSPRNSSGFAFEKAFSRLPDAFRVNYKSAIDEVYDDTQVLVYRDAYEGDGSRVEQVEYLGIVSEDDAVKRARYDLAQAEKRSTFYKLTAPVSSIICRRGSLVAVQHDLIKKHHGAARLLSFTTSGANLTTVTLDSEFDVYNNVDMHGVTDLHAITDMHTVGVFTSLAFLRTDGTVTVHPVTAGSGRSAVFTLVTPVPSTGIAVDISVVAGNGGQEYDRMVVLNIDPGPDFTAELTLVDEAPSLVGLL